VGSSV